MLGEPCWAEKGEEAWEVGVMVVWQCQPFWLRLSSAAAAADFRLACRETQRCICALKSLSGDARPLPSLFIRSFLGTAAPTTTFTCLALLLLSLFLSARRE